MRIFVTGATGYLGRNLVPVLENEGHAVCGVGSESCDLRKETSLDRFRESYGQIWHLAAWTQAGDFCLHHPAEQWIINQRINTNVLAWWQARQPQAKLIAIGSSCSYAPGNALTEECYMLGEPVRELYSYAMTKRMLLVGLHALNLQYGLRYLYLIPSTLFGPGYSTDGKQPHFIFDIIHKVILAKSLGDPPRLWGDGHQKRELIFIRDFIDAAIQLAARESNETVNIGSGREFSIRWYAEQVCRLLDYDPAAVCYDTEKYTGVRSKQLSIGKLRSFLPDFKFTPFETALVETVRWYRDSLQSELVQP